MVATRSAVQLDRGAVRGIRNVGDWRRVALGLRLLLRRLLFGSKIRGQLAPVRMAAAALQVVVKDVVRAVLGEA